MGDWGVEPWETDEAADWFGKYWNGGGIDLVIDEINNFSPKSESYDSLRAACLVLECFGSAYAWPFDKIDARESVLKRAIEILNNMIDPPGEDWGFLEMWDSGSSVIMSVRQQIRKLEAYLP